MNLTHGSLFSGIGGFDLAAEWAGFENKFHCEWNPFGQQVLNHHFPESESYADITKQDFSKWRDRITVLSGGFPCQPFSLAGKRKGADDDRYLWPEMLRAIREIRPLWVIGENVAGIATMVQPGEVIGVESQASLFEEDNPTEIIEQEYVIETVCRDLEQIGYSVQPMLIPACGVGAPHRRDRVWFIARLSAVADNTDIGDDVRIPGTDAASQGAQRVQERHAVRESVEPSGVFGSTSDTKSDGSCGASAQAGRTVEGSDRNKAEQLIERCEIWSTSDSGSLRYRGRRLRPGADFPKEREMDQHSQRNGDGVRSKTQGCGSVATDSDSVRLTRGKHEDGPETSVRQQSEGRDSRTPSDSKPRNDWQEFPTQPPVYSGDDGISRELAGRAISPSKWRQEAVKACGNAIVPQVAYEIFNAIYQLETLKYDHN